MNAPICWMGGKRRLRKQIIDRLPEHTCYAEAFGGAGWVLFGKEPSKVEVYNDIDGDLVNFFRVVKNCRRAFLQMFDLVLVSRRLFADFVNTDPAALDEIQRAVRFYYIIKNSFGGKWHGPVFGYAKSGKPRLNPDTIDETITAVHERLKRVYIEEGSFEKVITRYDGSGTVFYLDPPYYQTAGYRHSMALSDYERLSTRIGGIKGRFLLSLNDHPVMREVFTAYHIEAVECGYSIAKDVAARGKYGELLIRNY